MNAVAIFLIFYTVPLTIWDAIEHDCFGWRNRALIRELLADIRSGNVIEHEFLMTQRGWVLVQIGERWVQIPPGFVSVGGEPNRLRYDRDRYDTVVEDVEWWMAKHWWPSALGITPGQRIAKAVRYELGRQKVTT